jgi:hypothetical protein
MCHQGGDILGIGRHEGEGGHGTAAAREQLYLPDAQRLDDRVHVVRLNCRVMVDAAVLAGAAAEAARVVRDDGAVRKEGGQRGEAAGLHRLPDHEQRRAPVRRRHGAVEVVGEIGVGRLEHLGGRHRCGFFRIATPCPDL